MGDDNVNKVNVKTLLFSCLILFFAFTILSSSITLDKVDPLSDIEKKLAEISDEEREIIQNLFVMTQEIEGLELEQKRVAQEIDDINEEIHDITMKIESEKSNYEKKRETLKQVLKSYQKRGAGSYIEIILESQNLTEFIRRLNTIRDLTRNTGRLLEVLEESEKKLSMEKINRAEKLSLMEEKQELLSESLTKKLLLKTEHERYLLSLEEDKSYYQQNLANIQLLWEEFKPFFAEITREFSSIIEEGHFPSNALKTTIAFPNIKGSIDEKTFNDIIKDQPKLGDMSIGFNSDHIEIRIPSKNLVLSGKFVIIDEHTLKFEVEKGTFYGMPLEVWVIEELFKEGHLILDLKPLIGKSIIQSVEVTEGYLELNIKLVLF